MSGCANFGARCDFSVGATANDRMPHSVTRWSAQPEGCARLAQGRRFPPRLDLPPLRILGDCLAERLYWRGETHVGRRHEHVTEATPLGTFPLYNSRSVAARTSPVPASRGNSETLAEVCRVTVSGLSEFTVMCTCTRSMTSLRRCGRSS